MVQTPAQPRRQHPFALLVTRSWAPRLLATLGIVVLTAGLYVPVVGSDVLVRGDAGSRQSGTWAIWNTVGAAWALLQVGPLGRVSVPVQLGFDAVYSALTLGGLALIPLLWRPLSARGITVLRWTYTVWLVLLPTLVVADLLAWWQAASQPLPARSTDVLAFGAPYLLPRALAFPLGVLVCGAALLLLLKQPLPTLAQAPTRRTGWQWTAALVLTVGALVWSIGFYLMPQAITGPCPPVIFSVTQFVQGACAGLDSDQILHDAYYAGLNPLAGVLYSLGTHFELLVAAGCITTLGGWTRQLSLTTLAWLAVWPVSTFGVALVALDGVGVVAQQGFRLTATAAGWHLASGIGATFVGIGLVALGQFGLWHEFVRRKSPISAQ